MLSNIIIFLLTLFCYIHIYHHYKVNLNSELFYTEEPTTKAQLQELCDYREPFIFKTRKDEVYVTTMREFNEYPELEFNVRMIERNKKDYNSSDIFYTKFPVSEINKLLNRNATTHKYLIEGNHDVIENSKIKNLFTRLDQICRPDFTYDAKYDICSGTKGTMVPFQYKTSYRNFYCCSSGKASVILMPPTDKNLSLLNHKKNHNEVIYSSNLSYKDLKREKSQNNNVNYLKYKLTAGDVIYIPAFWSYSFIYDDYLSTLMHLDYRTFVNVIANAHNVGQHYLQKWNTQIQPQQIKVVKEAFETETSEKPLSKEILELEGETIENVSSDLSLNEVL